MIETNDIDPPPVLKSWAHVYVAVIVYLVLLILGLEQITRALSY